MGKQPNYRLRKAVIETLERRLLLSTNPPTALHPEVETGLAELSLPSVQLIQPAVTTLAGPTITAPGAATDNSFPESSLTPTFDWNSVPGASSYNLYISDAPYGTANIIYSATGLTGNTFTIPTGHLNSGTNYRWNMTTVNSAGEGSVGNTLYFQTTTPVTTLAGPTITAPGAATDNSFPESSLTPTFDWNSVPGASSYNLYISDAPYGTANIIYSATGLTGNTFTIPTGHLNSGTNYRWNMTTVNSAGEGSVGNTLYFQTTTPVTTLAGPTITAPGAATDNSFPESSLTPTFDWNSVPGASSYNLYISDAPYGTANIIYSATGLTGNTFTIPTGHLNSGTNYRWNMTTVNGAGEGSVGNTLYFQTTTPVTTLAGPTITAPGAATDNSFPESSLTPTFDWNSVPGASSYNLYISDAPYGTANIIYSATGLTGNTFTIPTGHLNSGTNYRWNMTTVNSAGEGSVGNTLYFQTTTPVTTLAGPTITAPGAATDNSFPESSLTPTFDWNSVPGASSYNLYISDAPYGTANIIYSATGLTGNTFTIPTGHLNSGTNYRWNMTTVNGAGEGSVGNTLYFQTTTPVTTLAGPTITAPGAATDNSFPESSLTPTFDWNSVPGASSYNLYISDAPYGTANIIYSATGLTGNTFTIPTGHLNSGTNYRWNMTTVNSAGEGSVGNTLYFQTTTPVTTLAGPTITAPGAATDNSFPESSLTPTFDWNSVPGASSYNLYISDAPYGTANIIYSATGLTGNTFTIPTGHLNSGTNYRWNMTTVNSAGEGSVGNTLYFQTTTPVTTLAGPTITAPGAATDNSFPESSLTPTFDWNSVPGASSYNLYISDAPYGTANIIYSATGLTGNTFTIPTGHLNSGTNYRWNMTTVNGAGEGSVGNTLYFQTTTPVTTLAGPTITAPGAATDNSFPESSLTPTFDWNSVPGASSYNLYISDAPYGTANIIYSATGLNGNTFTIPTGHLNSGTNYRWNMTTVNSAGEGSVGNTLYFQTTTPVTTLAGPTITAPGAATDNSFPESSLTPTFDWNSVPGASSYNLYISDAPYGTANIIYSATGLTGNTFTIPTGHLNSGTNYRWNMTTVNSAGEGSVGNTLYFQTTGGTGQPLATEYGLDYRAPGASATTGVNISAIKASGKQFIGEYIGTASNDGYLRPADVTALANQGLQIVSIFERNPTSLGYFTIAQADSDASDAIQAAMDAGQPSGSAIYFTVDFDPGSGASALSTIDGYFREMRRLQQLFCQHRKLLYHRNLCTGRCTADNNERCKRRRIL